MTDKSILIRLEEAGHIAPRVSLGGEILTHTTDERYEVAGEIARGGVGVVHKGRDNDLGRDVALKVLRDEHMADPELIQRFVEEAQIGGQLQHPGIVPVYELGLRSDQRPYFAMKLVKGKTLAARIAERSDPEDDRRALLAVFRDVCRTMAYAHARGVIHRDLKPANVMIGGFGEVQVVDWGFAKVLSRGGIADERLTRKAERDITMIRTVRSGEGSDSIAGSVMGTPAYMPPEQAMGRVEDLDEKSDVFSLGAILCEILTGEPPYTGSSADRLTAASQCDLTEAHARLAKCTADKRLVALVKRCLEPLPKNRVQSAESVADEVAASLTAGETRAHRAQMRAIKAEARVAEQSRVRRQTALLVSGVLAVLLVALGAWYWFDTAQARRDADRRVAVDAAMLDATRRLGEEDWDGTLAAVARATELGASGFDLEQIRDKATARAEAEKRAAEDDAFLAELDELRILADLRGEATDPKDHGRTLDAAYQTVFDARFPSIDASVSGLTGSAHEPAFAARALAWLDARVASDAGDPEALLPLLRKLDTKGLPLRRLIATRDTGGLLDELGESRHNVPLARVHDVAAYLVAEGKVERARELLDAYIDESPNDFWLHVAMGGTATAAFDTERAARAYNAALALRPDSAATWACLGFALARAGEEDDAKASYRRALELNPDLEDTLRALGHDIAKMGG